jgi:hypothetical protein
VKKDLRQAQFTFYEMNPQVNCPSWIYANLSNVFGRLIWALYEGKEIIPSSAYQSSRLTGKDFEPAKKINTPGLGDDLEKGLDENEE